MQLICHYFSYSFSNHPRPKWPPASVLICDSPRAFVFVLPHMIAICTSVFFLPGDLGQVTYSLFTSTSPALEWAYDSTYLIGLLYVALNSIQLFFFLFCYLQPLEGSDCVFFTFAFPAFILKSWCWLKEGRKTELWHFHDALQFSVFLDLVQMEWRVNWHSAFGSRTGYEMFHGESSIW